MVLSLEMDDEMIGMRMLSSLGRINLVRIRTGRMTEAEQVQANETLTRMSGAPFDIQHTPVLNTTDFYAPAPADSRAKMAVPG